MASNGDYAYVHSLDVMSEALLLDLKELEGRLGKVVQRAIKKLAKWLKTHALREIGRELKISQKALKSRFVISENSQSSVPSINVWFGLLNIAAEDIGSPSKNRRGVRVRGRQYESAFYKRVYGSKERVYIRAKRNAELNHPTASGSKSRRNKFSGAFLAQNSGRFPVQVVGVEISEIGLKVMRRYEARINARYQEILAQEVNYELRVKPNR